MNRKTVFSLFKVKFTIFLLFVCASVSAASFRSIFTELFADKEKLSTEIISCNQNVDLANSFICEKYFEINYRGDYRLFIALDFSREYEEQELPSFQDLPRDEREIIHKNNAAPILAKLLISDSDGNVLEDEINIDLTPTTLGATLEVFEVPGDLKLKEGYSIQFEFPRNSDTNVLFYERYSRINLIMRRLSSISR